MGAVGTPEQSIPFTLSTLFPDLVSFVVPASSLTYVSTGRTANISLPSYYGTGGYVTGPAAYESFAFGGLTLEGQGFLSSGGVSTMAII